MSFLNSIYLFLTQNNTFGIFLASGIIIALFVIWHEGRKDGFEEEKLLDIIAISLLVSFISAKVVDFALYPFKIQSIGSVVNYLLTLKLNVYALVLVFIYFVYLLSKRAKLSFYRIVDIFALGTAFVIAIASLGYIASTKELTFIYVFPTYILYYSIFSTLRNRVVKSGFTFSSFLLTSTVLMYVVLGRTYLPFYLLLITIALVVGYLRIRDQMSTLTPEFIEKTRKKLLHKDKELENEQKALLKEDPYTSYAEREDDNADVIDDAAEDIGHENIQVKVGIIKNIRRQVRKALHRISQGKYGVSEISGKPIPQERLEVYPQATTLVDEKTPDNA
ncbi:MAG: hypothetical protein RLY61_916 [Candidatus Parcubacteria bacterium]|jgi:DnaK suppressor protein